MQALTEQQKTDKGNELVAFFGLTQAKDENGKRYVPPRYNTGYGTKTALGVYLSVENAFFNRG